MLSSPDAPTPHPTVASHGLAAAHLQSMSIVQLFETAEQLTTRGNPALIVDLYQNWILSHPSDAHLFAACFNYGVVLRETGKLAEAADALRESIRLKPDFYPASINLGGLLEDKKSPLLAVDVWKGLITRLDSINAETIGYRTTALLRLAALLDNAGDLIGTEHALKLGLDLNNHNEATAQYLNFMRLRQCRWPVIEPWGRVSRRHLVSSASPFSLIHLADDPIFQLAKSYRFNRHVIGIPEAGHGKPAARPAGSKRKRKLRVGYVSADFKEHAGGFAMTDVLELHDRKAFEIFAYSCGAPQVDETQARIRMAVDHWIDLFELSDEAAASRISADDIDILVDLKGYTEGSRTRIFALRPAPVAVNWFGYPATMGSPYHHYIIADHYIIPEENELYYSESVLRLPCYQPNDRRRIVSPRSPTRQDEGLPPEAVVFCCLNGMAKLTPAVFGRWMTILGQVPGSVLWLLTGSEDNNARLRQRASQQGITPERLIFATIKPNPDHLARFPLADLFLDTFPCGAHTTAAESLWMGVPVLTTSGRGFASRVCGSVVTAAGLPDLVCETPDAYVAKAVQLGQDPADLAAVKHKLLAQRDSCLLFDTPNLVRELEGLYRHMNQAYKKGGRPVPNLDNLDMYNEIGSELDFDAMTLLSTPDYHSLYRDKITHLNNYSPVRPDRRLWPVEA